MKEAFSQIFKAGEHKNSLGRSAEVLSEVLSNKERLPELYRCISDKDAWVRMRAIDTLEKVFRQYPSWAEEYLEDMLTNLLLVDQASIQWHLAQIFSQVKLTDKQKRHAARWLSDLLSSTEVDWIVASNCMNALKQFMDEGYIERSDFEALLKIQLSHKSNAVVKRAKKYLGIYL